jgi:hypothetical protein
MQLLLTHSVFSNPDPVGLLYCAERRILQPLDKVWAYSTLNSAIVASLSDELALHAIALGRAEKPTHFENAKGL